MGWVVVCFAGGLREGGESMNLRGRGLKLADGFEPNEVAFKSVFGIEFR